MGAFETLKTASNHVVATNAVTPLSAGMPHTVGAVAAVACQQVVRVSRAGAALEVSNTLAVAEGLHTRCATGTRGGHGKVATRGSSIGATARHNWRGVRCAAITSAIAVAAGGGVWAVGREIGRGSNAGRLCAAGTSDGRRKLGKVATRGRPIGATERRNWGSAQSEKAVAASRGVGADGREIGRGSNAGRLCAAGTSDARRKLEKVATRGRSIGATERRNWDSVRCAKAAAAGGRVAAVGREICGHNASPIHAVGTSHTLVRFGKLATRGSPIGGAARRNRPGVRREVVTRDVESTRGRIVVEADRIGDGAGIVHVVSVLERNITACMLGEARRDDGRGKHEREHIFGLGGVGHHIAETTGGGDMLSLYGAFEVDGSGGYEAIVGRRTLRR